MSEETNESQTPRRTIGWVLAVLILLLLFMAATALLPDGDSRLIKPLVPTNTAVPVNYDATYTPVSFPDLQSDPEQYRDKNIQVRGRFTRLTPLDCVSFDGPVIRWGLISEDLQMNAQGMETLLHLIPADTSLTVEGVWRRYQGPSGCGKEPEAASVWYLVVSRIVQPNPLPLSGNIPVNDGGILPTVTETAVSNDTPETTTEPGVETVVPETPLPSNLTATPSATPQPIQITPTIIATSTEPPVTASTQTPTRASGGAPTVTAVSTTAATATPTATATQTPDATATPGSGSQPPIGVPTATPEAVETSSYPAPEATSTPPSSYP